MAKQICPACREVFAGTTAGDTHRVGNWDVPQGHPMYRRCLSVFEMELRGMIRNSYGHWSTGETYDG